MPMAWQDRISKIFLSPQDFPTSAKVAEIEFKEKYGYISLLLYHSPSMLLTHYKKTDLLSPLLNPPLPSPQSVCTPPLASGQATSNVAKHPTALGYATSFPSRAGLVEVELGEGHGSQRELAALPACLLV